MTTTPRKRTTRRPARQLDARPDTADFRDRLFEPTLVDVPARADPRAGERSGAGAALTRAARVPRRPPRAPRRQGRSTRRATIRGFRNGARR